MRFTSAQSTTWVGAFAVSFVMSVTAWAAFVAYDRTRTMEQQRNGLLTNVRLLEQQTDAALDAGASLLASIERILASPVYHDAHGDERLVAQIDAALAGAPHLGAAWVLDADGIVVLDSTNPYSAEPVSADDRDYFRAHRDGDGGLYIGGTGVGRISGKARFTMSQAMTDPHGRLRGVCAVSVLVEPFEAIFRSIDPAGSMSVALLRGDGTLLAAWPRQPETPVALPPSGTISARVMLGDYPVAIVAWKPLAVALAPWRERAIWSATALGSLLLTLSSLTLLGLAAARREGYARRDLARANRMLEQRVAERTAELSRIAVEKDRLASHSETVAREMSHRMMNSFQLLNALLALEVRRIADPGARGVVQQALRRVQAIAVVHRRLFEETRHDVATLDLGDYLRGLAGDAARAFAGRRPVAVEVRAAPGLRYRADRAITLGMIVTELILNALKHAFEDDQGGRLTVRLEAAGDRYRVTVGDDGRGLPQGFDELPGTGVGATVVKRLVEQLEATLEVDRRPPGCRFTIDLPGLAEPDSEALPLFQETPAA